MNARTPISGNQPVEVAMSLYDAADEAIEASYLEQAREKIVETVMLFGQYPQPRRVGMFLTTGSNRPVQFSLHEFLFDTAKVRGIDPVEAQEFFVLAITDYSNCGAFADQRSRFEKRVTEMLTEYLTDEHALVKEVAEELKEDDQL